jgi:PKD domain/Subtilase family
VRSRAIVAALAWSLLATLAAWTSPSASAATGYAQVRRVCPPPAPGDATCEALLRSTVASSAPGARPYALNEGASSSGPAGGMTPAQLASAYEYQPATGRAGQTVAIVDAFDDPQIEEDLGKFDTHYGLAACTTADGCFQKVGQSGSATSLPKADKTGWSVEISLDVETVHAVCPGCKILLVEANNESFKDLAQAVNEAVSLGATQVSNSYAGPEEGLGEAERAAYDHAGVLIAAATGDDGYYGWDFINESEAGAQMPNAPASLPSVVAVGGTSLHLNAQGTRASETVWNNNGPGDKVGLASGFAEGATGGGCSTLFTAPPWQQSTPGFAASDCGSRRLAGDIAAVADPNTGFDIYDTYNCGFECELFGIGKGKGWFTVGGTSLATPLISALSGLAGGSQGVRYPALTLYGHLADASALYDVTKGGDGFCDGESQPQCGNPDSVYGAVDCKGSTACNAAPGFDGPSGVGTPHGLEAFKPLFPTAVITSPSSLEAGVPASFSAGSSSDPYPGGEILGYSWSWGDGSADSGGVSPTHVYPAVGSYTVTLTLTDN